MWVSGVCGRAGCWYDGWCRVAAAGRRLLESSRTGSGMSERERSKFRLRCDDGRLSDWWPTAARGTRPLCGSLRGPCMRVRGSSACSLHCSDCRLRDWWPTPALSTRLLCHGLRCYVLWRWLFTSCVFFQLIFFFLGVWKSKKLLGLMLILVSTGREALSIIGLVEC